MRRGEAYLNTATEIKKRRNSGIVHIFAHFMQGLSARQFDVSEKMKHNGTNRINWLYVRKNLTTQTCLLGIDARKFKSPKISTFTVHVSF